MAQLAETEFRTVIEDARARHAAVVMLIHQTDTQAMNLLRLYVTLTIATASGAAAMVNSASGALVTALVAMSIVLAAGSAFCLRALRSGAINAPGRDPDFWLWALHPDVDRDAALRAYLDNLKAKLELNRNLNQNTATALTWSKRCGVAAPLLGIASAAGWTVGRLV